MINVRKRGSVVAFIVCVVPMTITTTANGASAEPGEMLTLSNGEIVPARADMRNSSQEEAFRADFGEMVAQGVTDEVIERRLGLTKVSIEQPHMQPSTSNSNVTLSTPGLWKDTPANQYYASASWNFTVIQSGLGSIGGPDGFAISFSNHLNNLGGLLTVCSTSGGCVNSSTYAINNAYGIGFTFQDAGIGNTMSNKTGSLIFQYKRLQTGCLQAFTKYSHTWDSTSLTGIGIGLWQIFFSWDTSSHQWTRASAAGKDGCP